MFYLINKPRGISSFDVIRKLRKILQIRKIGHTGTLDPLAEWCLLIATWNSTKLIPYIDKAEKTYKASISLDWVSESLDLGTNVIKSDDSFLKKKEKELSYDIVQKYIEETLLWKQNQIPPKYSAIHINGVRAYELARKNIDVTMPIREIEIFSSKLLSYHFPIIEIEVTVSSGTYIRSLAHDIGLYFWCDWWYLTRLIRTQINTLHIDDSQDLEIFNADIWISHNNLFPDIWILKLSEKEYIDIKHGRSIWCEWKENIVSSGSPMFLSYNDEIFAIGEMNNELIQVSRNNIA
jgi:tRNA pseudouridine55 synthase